MVDTSLNDDDESAVLNAEQERFAQWYELYMTRKDEMDMTQYAASESNDLKAADFEGKNLKVRIEAIDVRHYEARNDQPATDKPALRFYGKEKTLVLNKTNTKRMIAAYGKDSDEWLDKEIGLSTQETELGVGWVVTPLNVQPPDFEDDIPF
jgi:hypothetical protein